MSYFNLTVVKRRIMLLKTHMRSWDCTLTKNKTGVDTQRCII